MVTAEYLQQEVVSAGFFSQSLITLLEMTTFPERVHRKSNLALWFSSGVQRALEIQAKHFKTAYVHIYLSRYNSSVSLPNLQ